MFTAWEIAGQALAPCASIVFVWMGAREVPKFAAVCIIAGAAFGYAVDRPGPAATLGYWSLVLACFIGVHARARRSKREVLAKHRGQREALTRGPPGWRHERCAAVTEAPRAVVPPPQPLRPRAARPAITPQPSSTHAWPRRERRVDVW